MRSAPSALIAGLGLIGGSIGIALRASGWHIAFVDPHVDLPQAQKAGAADERSESLNARADLVILATPVDAAIQLIGAPRGSATMTSVCSVMAPLRDAAKSERFVAGHPLAGSERHGLAAANGDLFRERPWFVERHDEIVDRMIRDCGARIEIVDPQEHDAAVALTSHLPQLLSTALAAHLDGESERRAAAGQPDLRAFAGSGLGTFLRLASSDASIWSSVLDANRGNLLPHMDAVMKIVRQILDGDTSPFDRAQRFMEKLKP